MTTENFIIQISEINSLLFCIAIRYTSNKEDAKDLMQETIMRAYIHHDKFTEGTNFKAWTATIMRNCHINDYRKNRARNDYKNTLKKNTTVAVENSVENLAPSIMGMQELQGIVDNLTDGNRIPFEMFFNGFEYKEIAEQLHIPMGTVKSRIFFARKKLKKIINYYFDREYSFTA